MQLGEFTTTYEVKRYYSDGSSYSSKETHLDAAKLGTHWIFAVIMLIIFAFLVLLSPVFILLYIGLSFETKRIIEQYKLYNSPFSRYRRKAIFTLMMEAIVLIPLFLLVFLALAAHSNPEYSEFFKNLLANPEVLNLIKAFSPTTDEFPALALGSAAVSFVFLSSIAIYLLNLTFSLFFTLPSFKSEFIQNIDMVKKIIGEEEFENLNQWLDTNKEHKDFEANKEKIIALYQELFKEDKKTKRFLVFFLEDFFKYKNDKKKYFPKFFVYLNVWSLILITLLCLLAQDVIKNQAFYKEKVDYLEKLYKENQKK